MCVILIIFEVVKSNLTDLAVMSVKTYQSWVWVFACRFKKREAECRTNLTSVELDESWVCERST